MTQAGSPGDLGFLAELLRRYPVRLVFRGEVLPEGPVRGERLLEEGELALYHMGRYPEAEASYRQVLVQDPGNLDARWGLAEVALALGRTKEAELLSRQLLALERFVATFQVWRKRGVWGEMRRKGLAATKAQDHQEP
ncbi:O-linked N-acetylglucosamine transferase [Thermus parvatiensis]|uniref:O-linked N-acetylglucosamine transferase n=1 Tax=Thermus parvatiensis TaxID=456163 RepID=H7GE80_9DEIN|nr:tetratricopeptide repeat protein [Thermus parvatiensis]EIA40022.1 O-linked N-acetylglucosamine transferase [Thermus parvatiensis]